MEFNSLHEFFMHTKTMTYLLMGGILVGAVLWWQFLMGEKKPIDNPHRTGEGHDNGHGH